MDVKYFRCFVQRTIGTVDYLAMHIPNAIPDPNPILGRSLFCVVVSVQLLLEFGITVTTICHSPMVARQARIGLSHAVTYRLKSHAFARGAGRYSERRCSDNRCSDSRYSDNRYSDNIAPKLE